MGKSSPQAIAPRYLQEFRCAGGNCPDTCCQGWRVAVDKPTFQKYRAVKDADLNARLRTHVVRANGAANTTNYAVIKLRSDNHHCHFFTPDGLCEVQQRLGADHLSTTCAQYPRHHAASGPRLSVYASASCPEVTRLMLASPDAVDPQETTLPFANASLVPVQRRRASAGMALPQELADESLDLVQVTADLIHQTAALLVRSPHLSAAQALVAIGLLVRRLARLAQSPLPREEMLAQTAAVLDEAQDEASHAASRSHIESLQDSAGLQLAVLWDATARYVEATRGGLRLAGIVADATQGSGYVAADPEVTAANYRRARDDWFAPFDSAHPHLLKNYLLNDLGLRQFPMRNARQIEDELMQLGVRYALVRLYLVGLAGQRRTAFGVTDYQRVIQAFARDVEHHRDFITTVLRVLDDAGLKNLATLAILVA